MRSLFYENFTTLIIVVKLDLTNNLRNGNSTTFMVLYFEGTPSTPFVNSVKNNATPKKSWRFTFYFDTFDFQHEHKAFYIKIHYIFTCFCPNHKDTFTKITIHVIQISRKLPNCELMLLIGIQIQKRVTPPPQIHDVLQVFYDTFMWSIFREKK